MGNCYREKGVNRTVVTIGFCMIDGVKKQFVSEIPHIRGNHFSLKDGFGENHELTVTQDPITGRRSVNTNAFERRRDCDAEVVDEEAAFATWPCAKCKKLPIPISTDTGTGIDACFGGLVDGVHAACCGHGVSPGYVSLMDGWRL